MADWWRCPNDPPCPHPGLTHDIHDFDDPRPICCTEGCDCGQRGERNVDYTEESYWMRRRSPSVPDTKPDHPFQPYQWEPNRCGYVNGDDEMCGAARFEHRTEEEKAR